MLVSLVANLYASNSFEAEVLLGTLGGYILDCAILVQSTRSFDCRDWLYSDGNHLFESGLNYYLYHNYTTIYWDGSIRDQI